MIRRAEGIVELGPIGVGAEAYFTVWFPSTSAEVATIARIPEATLSAAGVDFSERDRTGLRPLIEAEINDEASTADEINPKDLVFRRFIV